MRKLIWYPLLGFMVGGICLWPLSGLAGPGDFPEFFLKFKQAVARGDKYALADMCDFKEFVWEGQGGPIATRREFLDGFEKLFTPGINKRLERAEPIKTGDNSYFASWKDQGLEFDIDFIRDPDKGFIWLGLTVGPQ